MTDLERFFSKVEKGVCWEWTATKHPKGYGHFRIGGTMRRAHRVAYSLLVGPIPKEAHVLHTCDNPSCVNPDHLFLGTNRDNVEDKVQKGRAAKVLTLAQARAIYNDSRPQKTVAREYGISQSQVSRIKTGAQWARLGGRK